MSMLMRRVPNPAVYALCKQTVTLYHKNGAEYVRTIIEKAYLETNIKRTLSKDGATSASGFLLVIPESSSRYTDPASFALLEEADRAGWYTIEPGDKVLNGNGLTVSTREEWAKLIPSAVPELVVVGTVKLLRWKGALSHVEATE